MKLKIGDSIKFKDGRQGTVEKEDNKFFYIKDTNDKVVKLKKDASPLEEAMKAFYQDQIYPAIAEGIKKCKDDFKYFLEDEANKIDLGEISENKISEDFDIFTGFRKDLTFEFEGKGIDIVIFPELRGTSFKPFEGKVGVFYTIDGSDFDSEDTLYFTKCIKSDFFAEALRTETDLYVIAAEFSVPVSVQFDLDELKFEEK